MRRIVSGQNNTTNQLLTIKKGVESFRTNTNVMPRKQTESRIELSQDIRWQIFKSADGTCAHCGCKMQFYKDFTIEHVIPLYKGGTNRSENLVALCRTCNKEKSDHVIRPAGYYKYLSKTRLAELEQLFDKYLETTDWLAYDNLFQTDQESMTVLVEQTVRSGYVAQIPMTVQIQKISTEEAFEWLQFYTARLNTEDKSIMAHTPDALKSPYYRISNGNTTYMLVTAYVAPINYVISNTTVNKKLHGVRLDLFTNPDLTNKPGLTCRLMYASLSAVMDKIQETLLRGYERDSLVQCAIEYPASDTYASAMFEYIECCQPGLFTATQICDEHGPIQSIKSCTAWFYQGKPAKRLSDVDPRLEGTAEEIQQALSELSNPFKERLTGARRLKTTSNQVKRKPKKKATNYKQKHHPKWTRRKRK